MRINIATCYIAIAIVNICTIVHIITIAIAMSYIAICRQPSNYVSI